MQPPSFAAGVLPGAVVDSVHALCVFVACVCVCVCAGQVWRLMLQLRWVRHRVDHARLTACKGGAKVNDLHARDRREAEQVAAAAAYSGRGWGQQGGPTGGSSSSSSSSSFAHQQGPGGAAGGGVLDWLSGREELLLLQDMGHFMAQWHSYVLAGIVSKGWSELEKVSPRAFDQLLGPALDLNGGCHLSAG